MWRVPGSLRSPMPARFDDLRELPTSPMVNTSDTQSIAGTNICGRNCEAQQWPKIERSNQDSYDGDERHPFADRSNMAREHIAGSAKKSSTRAVVSPLQAYKAQSPAKQSPVRKARLEDEEKVHEPNLISQPYETLESYGCSNAVSDVDDNCTRMVGEAKCQDVDIGLYNAVSKHSEAHVSSTVGDYVEFDVPGIMLAGYLFKLKRNRSIVGAAWNKRWFVVNGRMLHYYKWRAQRDDAMPAGSLNLSKVTTLRYFHDAVNGGQNGDRSTCTFQLSTGSRELILRAPNANDAWIWVSKLTKICPNIAIQPSGITSLSEERQQDGEVKPKASDTRPILQEEMVDNEWLQTESNRGWADEHQNDREFRSVAENDEACHVLYEEWQHAQAEGTDIRDAPEDGAVAEYAGDDWRTEEQTNGAKYANTDYAYDEADGRWGEMDDYGYGPPDIEYPYVVEPQCDGCAPKQNYEPRAGSCEAWCEVNTYYEQHENMSEKWTLSGNQNDVGQLQETTCVGTSGSCLDEYNIEGEGKEQFDGGNVQDEGKKSETNEYTTSILNKAHNTLFSLTRHNRYDAASSVLERGNVGVDSCNEHGNTMLMIACQNNNKRMAKLALRHGANIDAQNDKGNTALHAAFHFGYGQTLGAYLISKGADATIRNSFGATCVEGLGGSKGFIASVASLKNPYRLIGILLHCTSARHLPFVHCCAFLWQ